MAPWNYFKDFSWEKNIFQYYFYFTEYLSQDMFDFTKYLSQDMLHVSFEILPQKID